MASYLSREKSSPPFTIYHSLHDFTFFLINWWILVPVLAGVIDPDYQGEFGLVLPHGAEEDCIGNAGDPLGSLSITILCD